MIIHFSPERLIPLPRHRKHERQLLVRSQWRIMLLWRVVGGKEEGAREAIERRFHRGQGTEKGEEVAVLGDEVREECEGLRYGVEGGGEGAMEGSKRDVSERRGGDQPKDRLTYAASTASTT